MEIIAKISRGSKMDQIYLPKNRFGLNPGSYVLVREISYENEEKLFYYNIKNLEKVKIIITKEMFKLLNKYNFDNVIITGSFLDQGFNLNDMDIILIKDHEISLDQIKIELNEKSPTEKNGTNRSTFQACYFCSRPILPECIQKKHLHYFT